MSSPTAGPRRRAAASVALLLAAAVALAVLPSTTPAGAEIEDLPEDVADDPEVRRALDELEADRAEADEASAEAEGAREAVEAADAELTGANGELDEAAAEYEELWAQYEGLRAERAAEEAVVAEAEADTVEVRAEFGEQIADVYKSAPLELQLSDLVLAEDSPSTALHRLGMLGRLSAASAARVGEARRTVERTMDRARQHEVVTVGIAGAAAELRANAARLEAQVAAAERRVAAARAEVAAAEQAASQAELAVAEAAGAAEEEVAAARRRVALAAEVSEGGYRLPAVDGKVCPIGAPHGFSDSWGAPRSGGRQHKGVDMFAAHGMPLYAVADGTVRVSSNRLGGLSVHLTAPNGDRYYYAHLASVALSTGETVRAGDVIGANGNSGNARSTPPHLHWQYHPGGGAAVNPTPLATALCRG